MARAPAIDVLSERLSARRAKLSPTEQLVASWIERHRIEALAQSALEIGAAVGTSDATVIRAVRALGFSGLAELRHILATSLQAEPEGGSRPGAREVDQGSDDAVVASIADQAATLHKLSAPRSVAAIGAAIKALNPVSRIALFGIGPSEFPAQYGAFLLNRYGRPAYALHHTGLRLADQLMQLAAGDGLLILSFGKAFQEVAAVVHEGRRHGLPMIFVTDDAENKFATHAASTIMLQRPIVNGLTMHGPTFMLIETIALGLAAADPIHFKEARERLNDLRAGVGGPRLR